ncbi:MAG TPA: DUF4274 domain-containing protein [Sphingomicrobium sp.]|nr:DUF4274 domain-containing protein [Sphingomicrobium sp.]
MIDLDEDEQRAIAENIAWLQSNDPDDWHRVALDFNWGEPLYLLDWIIRQPRCDAATALTIFWKGEPAAWIEEDDSSPEEPNGFSYLNKQICTYVAERVAAGGYERSEIAFTPTTWTKKDYVDLVALDQTLANPNFRTTPELIRSRPGRNVDLNADFYRRYPDEFHHSYYDEQLSHDLERGAYETPRSRELSRNVDEVERQTLESLPEWLRGRCGSRRLALRTGAHSDGEGATARSTAITASDASQRVRLMRHDAQRAANHSTEHGSSLPGWLRRLLGR